jgi:enoyl-CoA hydratase
MDYRTLLCNIDERIATVTINRPDKLNALNAEIRADLKRCFAALKNDPEVDVVIVTGAGEKAFVAGADIAELAVLNGETGRAMSSSGQGVFDDIENLGKPVIAAVNGYALGGGCELAMACHLRIASENARFGQPEVTLGVIPGYGGTQRLARLVGRGRAMELILTGLPIDAQEAFRIGLVNKIVPPAELLDRARMMAKAIGSFGQIAVRMALKAVNITEEVPLSEGERLEASLFGVCCESPDFWKNESRSSDIHDKRKPPSFAPFPGNHRRCPRRLRPGDDDSRVLRGGRKA